MRASKMPMLMFDLCAPAAAAGRRRALRARAMRAMLYAAVACFAARL